MQMSFKKLKYFRLATARMTNQCVSGAREIEAELKRRVAYLAGGKDRAGVSLIVVPVGTDSAGLCHWDSSAGAKESPRIAPPSAGDDWFDAQGTALTRSEEEHCQDLDRVLRYLHSIVRLVLHSIKFINQLNFILIHRIG